MPCVPRALSQLPVIFGSGTCGTVHTDGKDLFWFSAIVVSSLRTLLYFLSGGPGIPINSQQAIGYVSLGKKKKKGVTVYCLYFYLLQTLSQSLCFHLSHYVYPVRIYNPVFFT